MKEEDELYISNYLKCCHFFILTFKFFSETAGNPQTFDRKRSRRPTTERPTAEWPMAVLPNAEWPTVNLRIAKRSTADRPPTVTAKAELRWRLTAAGQLAGHFRRRRRTNRPIRRRIAHCPPKLSNQSVTRCEIFVISRIFAKLYCKRTKRKKILFNR